MDGVWLASGGGGKRGVLIFIVKNSQPHGLRLVQASLQRGDGASRLLIGQTDIAGVHQARNTVSWG